MALTIGMNGPGMAMLCTADAARAVAAVKAALRIASDDEDVLIETLANSAIGLAEQFLGQALLVRGVQEVLPVTTGWQRLSASPIRAISAVAGIADDGTVTALPVIGYAIDIDARGDGWVRISDGGGARRVAVTAEAGSAADWDALPAALRQGVVMLAAYLFSERDTTVPPPMAITALWRPYRRMMIGLPAASRAAQA